MNTEYPHKNNISAKYASKKYGIGKYKKLLNEINKQYLVFIENISKIQSFDRAHVDQKTALLNIYLDFLYQDKFKVFTAQSKLHSSVLEEFCLYLFRDAKDFNGFGYTLGSIKAYTNLYFSPENFEKFAVESGVFISVKDQDFTISKKIICDFNTKEDGTGVRERKEIFVPVVAVECKTYIDKTMFDGACQSAEKLKSGNPFALMVVICETNEMGRDINPNHSKIDQIFILRKDSKGNPIDNTLVWDFFCLVRSHLEKQWFDPANAIAAGKLITR